MNPLRLDGHRMKNALRVARQLGDSMLAMRRPNDCVSASLFTNRSTISDTTACISGV